MKKNRKIIQGHTNGKAAHLALFATTGSGKGEVNLQWDAVKNARQYIVQVSVNGGKMWKYADIISEPHYTLSRLMGSRKYSIRVAPVFSGGQGRWSKPVIKKVK